MGVFETGLGKLGKNSVTRWSQRVTYPSTQKKTKYSLKSWTEHEDFLRKFDGAHERFVPSPRTTKNKKYFLKKRFLSTENVMNCNENRTREPSKPVFLGGGGETVKKEENKFGNESRWSGAYERLILSSEAPTHPHDKTDRPFAIHTFGSEGPKQNNNRQTHLHRFRLITVARRRNEKRRRNEGLGRGGWVEGEAAAAMSRDHIDQ